MTAIPTPKARRTPAERISVWDLPTRVFHWSLVGLVLLSWFTGEGEGSAVWIHRLSGEAIAGLIVFRVIWGLVGGEHARFSSFLRPPGAVTRHLGQLIRGKAEPSLGHNPLGGLSILMLLASAAVVVATGLFSFGEEGGPGGPLAGAFGWDLSRWHEPAFRVLQGLVVLHLLGVVATSLASRDNLVRAMITGYKVRSAEGLGLPARPASTWALLAAVVVAASTTAYLISLPPSHAAAASFQARGHTASAPLGAERNSD